MTRSRIVQWSALRRWLPGHEGLPDSTFPLVPIDEFTERVVEPIEGSERQLNALNLIAKITFGGELHLRSEEQKKGYKGKLFRAYPGQLIFSKIRVGQGSLCVVPDTLGHVAVSAEYPVYQPDLDAIDPIFLSLLLRTNAFKSILQSLSSGNTTKKRIRPEQFEALQVPLPERHEQQRIVADHVAAYAEANRLDAEAHRMEAEAVEAFEAALGLIPPPDLPRVRSRIARFTEMDRWSHAGALHAALRGEHVLESNFEIVSVDDVAEVTYGLQKSPSNRPKDNPRPYLRVANVQRGYLDLKEVKLINVPDRDMPKYQLMNGDLLLCEGNSADLVGRGAVWRNEIPGCVHQNHVLRVRIDDFDEVSPEFLLACINSPFGQAYFRSKAKQTTNLATINSNEVRQFSFPLPPRHKQDALLQVLVESQSTAEFKRRSAAVRRAAADAAFTEAVFG